MIGASGRIGRDSRRKNGDSNALLEDGIVVSHALVFGNGAGSLYFTRKQPSATFQEATRK